MKGIYTRERFTEEEVDIANRVADIVCHVFKISDDELRGSSRVRPLPDARKVFAHYICNNIKLEKVMGSYNVALATWYLNQHHSTICYAVEQANDLYETDMIFRYMYDSVVTIINNPEDYVELTISPSEAKKMELRWEDVRLNPRFSYEVKESLIPEKVFKRIVDMSEMGYSNRQIAYDAKISKDFLKYILDKNCIQKKKLMLSAQKLRENLNRVSFKRYSTTIDY